MQDYSARPPTNKINPMSPNLEQPAQPSYSQTNQQEQPQPPYGSQQAGAYGQPAYPQPTYGQYNPGQYGGAPAPYGNSYYGAPQQPIPGPQPPYYGQPTGPPSMAPPHGPPPQTMWMQRPPGIGNCPPGLEYLTQIDQLIVHQKVELTEAFLGGMYEGLNKYDIKNTLGQRIYFAAEDSEPCMRQCCGNNRAFSIHIVDNAGIEVIRVHRPFKFCAGEYSCLAGINCCADEVQIEGPVGSVLGHVRQTFSCLAPCYNILDATGKVILRIEGPTCVFSGPCCMVDQDFLVLSGNDKVGRISKQWSGLAKEFFTTATNFGVSFPIDLDVKMKAVMIGAVFLIDFMFFENHRND